MKKLLSILILAIITISAFFAVPASVAQAPRFAAKLPAAPSMETPNLKTIKKVMDNVADAYIKMAAKDPSPSAYKEFKDQIEVYIALCGGLEILSFTGEEESARSKYANHINDRVEAMGLRPLFDEVAKEIAKHSRFSL